jgi:FkbM family methyltransferase
MLDSSDVSAARPTAPDSLLAISRCRYGTMMYLRQDIYIARSFAEYGEYSEGEVEQFRRWLRPGDVAVDIGANFGSHTIPMAQLVGPTGFVHAFEPQRILFQILSGNVVLNELLNVRTLPLAVGRAAGRLKAPPVDYRARNNFGGVAFNVEYPFHHEEISLVTLDQLELESLRLLKIDVEGMELDVLLGAAATIARCRPILYVENDRIETSEALAAHLLSAGYRLWWHTPLLWNPDNFLRNPNNIFRRIMSFNMLCVPREMAEAPAGLREIVQPSDASAFLRSFEPPKS